MSAVGTIEQAEEETVEPAAITATAKRLFRYSAFIHLGEGAQECPTARALEAKEDPPVCTNPEHFHAWCRLPNPYQEKDIRKKAEAAKARHLRALKDPESDVAVVFDSELAGLSDPSFKESLINELMGDTWAQNYLDAQNDVIEMEEFEHIDQDREEYTRLHEQEKDLPESEQSDEYKRLRNHIQRYLDAINTRREELERPRREELGQREFDALLGLVRDKRMDAEGDRSFIDTFNAWCYFVGTFRVTLHPTLRRPTEPMWDEIGRPDRPTAGSMFAESEEVITALTDTFNELRASFRLGASGN